MRAKSNRSSFRGPVRDGLRDASRLFGAPVKRHVPSIFFRRSGGARAPWGAAGCGGVCSPPSSHASVLMCRAPTFFSTKDNPVLGPRMQFTWCAWFLRMRRTIGGRVRSRIVGAGSFLCGGLLLRFESHAPMTVQMRNPVAHQRVVKKGTTYQCYTPADVQEVVRLVKEVGLGVRQASARVHSLVGRRVPIRTAYRILDDPSHSARPGPPPVLTEERRSASCSSSSRWPTWAWA